MIEIDVYIAPVFETIATPGARKFVTLSMHFQDGVLGFVALRTPRERVVAIPAGTDNVAISFDDDGDVPLIPQASGQIHSLKDGIEKLFTSNVKGVHVVPARYDVLCSLNTQTCEVWQPSDDPEYEPGIPLGPGMAAVLFYTTAENAIRSALLGEEPAYFMVSIASTRDGDVAGFGLSTSTLHVIAAARDRYSFLAGVGGAGLFSVADDQRLIDSFVRELNGLGNDEETVFLGALVFEDTGILAGRLLASVCGSCGTKLTMDDKLSRIFQ